MFKITGRALAVMVCMIMASASAWAISDNQMIIENASGFQVTVSYENMAGKTIDTVLSGSRLLITITIDGSSDSSKNLKSFEIVHKDVGSLLRCSTPSEVSNYKGKRIKIVKKLWTQGTPAIPINVSGVHYYFAIETYNQ